MKISLVLLSTVALLAACSPGNEPHYLITATPAEKSVRIKAKSVEIRQVSLPSYAGGEDFFAQGEDGALFKVSGALWADEPARGITGALVRSLGEQTGASVASEPWPLNDDPQARIDVRLDHIFARSDHSFSLAGQFAVSSPDASLREFVRRFDISVPILGEGTSAVANAQATALSELTAQIAKSLK